MFKTLNFLLLPLLLNYMIIIMMMMPSKTNKFHPMMLMLILIFLIFLISMKMNFLFYSWISYILFLIMIGGLMVIYMYITSLANNEFFFLNLKLIIKNLLKMTPMLLICMIIYFKFNQYLMFNMNIQDSWMINKYPYLQDQMNMNIMYKELNNKATFFIMIYLYYSMICIMNICYKFKSPMRQLMF